MSITPLQDNALEPTLSTVMERYRKSVSILKKGFVQESYRIAKIKRSKKGANINSAVVRQITVCSGSDPGGIGRWRGPATGLASRCYFIQTSM